MARMINTSVKEIAALVGGNIIGDNSIQITGINGIREAAAGDIAFVVDQHYAKYIPTTGAVALIVPESISEAPMALIQVEDPRQAMTQLLEAVNNDRRAQPQGIHPSAVIAGDAQVAANAAVGANACIEAGAVLEEGTVVHPCAYIGPNSRIGAHTVIHPHATVLDEVRIGARCIIHSGAVIGSDGFGFSYVHGERRKIPQIGRVVIEDDVEIGGNTCVDRATMGSTYIGPGTKIDNLVHIAHNCHIGENCVISGTSGMAGSTTIGNHVTIGANAGFAGHLEVGDHAVVAARAGVTKSIPAGKVVSGFPATDHATERRYVASIRRLPEGLERIRALEHRIEELEGILNGKAKDHR